MKYKYYWRGYIEQMVYRYNDLVKDTTPHSRRCVEAIDEAIEEIGKLQCGRSRQECMTLIYKKNLRNNDIVADRFYVSRRTVQRWKSDFIYRVAKKLDVV